MDKQVIDVASFDELIDAYQSAQKDGTLVERASARAALKNAYRAALPSDAGAPLTGKWRFANGVLCNGSLRIAREDFDTLPSENVRADITSWIADTLNAAPVAPKES